MNVLIEPAEVAAIFHALYLEKWLSSRSAGNLQIDGSLDCPFFCQSTPTPPPPRKSLPECLSFFPLVCPGSKDRGFIRFSRIPVGSRNAWNARKPG